jgi:hypothetical protein
LHYSFPSNPLHNRIQHLKYLISGLGYIIGIYRFRTINQKNCK